MTTALPGGSASAAARAAAGSSWTGGSAPWKPRHAALALLWAALALFFYVLLPLQVAPGEDAVILYLYSENLARTGVISYSAGGAPIEGATDFLWMVVLAGLHRIGLPTYLAATVLSGVAHLGTALLAHRMAGGRDLRVLFGAAFGLFLVPAVFAAVQGFSPFVFGFSILLGAWFFHRERAVALALTSLFTCLVRPDGVVFVVPLLLALLLLQRGRRAALLRSLLLCFLLPGLAYFAWRSWYFGQLLPLPFYVKSDFERFLGVFKANTLARSLTHLATLLPLLLLLWWKARELAPRERAKILALVVGLLLVPSLFYGTVLLLQNVGLRFQYPILLAALALPLLCDPEQPAPVSAPDPRAPVPRRRLHLAAAGLTLALQSREYLLAALSTALLPLENVPALARDLARLPCSGSLAVTEAGRLPYYSGWACTDLWGLNTPEFARRVVTPADLERLAPDLVVLHSGHGTYNQLRVAGAALPEQSRRSWGNMTQNVYLAMVRQRYELVMVPFERESGSVPRWFAGVVRLARRIQESLGHAGRYDMYFVAPDSDCREGLLRVLAEHGGVSYPEYESLRLLQH